MAPASARAGFWGTAAQAVLDGVLLAVLSLPIIAFFLGQGVGMFLQALLFAGYVGLVWNRRSIYSMLSAVVLAAGITGAFFLITGRRKSRPLGPPPNPAMVAVLRSALLDYRVKHKGAYPSRLEDLTPEFAARVPVIQTAAHKPSAASEYYGAEVCTPEGLEPSHLRDTGHWGYVNDPKAPCWGWVFVDCIHMDAEGKPFYGY